MLSPQSPKLRSAGIHGRTSHAKPFGCSRQKKLFSIAWHLIKSDGFRLRNSEADFCHKRGVPPTEGQAAEASPAFLTFSILTAINTS
jgi:hypothetical protein